MAGYNGYSKSNNAVDAEAEGRYPITHAMQIVRALTGCTAKAAKAALLEYGDNDEWHHSSKKYNRVAYYDTKPSVMALMGFDTDDTEAVEEYLVECVDSMIRADRERITKIITDRDREEKEWEAGAGERVRAYREAEARKAELARIEKEKKATCPHSNTKVICQTQKGGYVIPVYRKCLDCHTNYLPL